jgi:signal transduction histidine kinase
VRGAGLRLLRGLLFQIVLWSIVPLLAITIVSVISIYGHQQAMRGLMTDQVARLARVTAADLSDRLADRVGLLQTLAEAESIHPHDPRAQQQALDQATPLHASFDRGVALLDPTGNLLAQSGGVSAWLAQPSLSTLTAQVSARGQAGFAPASLGPPPANPSAYVTLLAVPVSTGGVLVGAFSPASLHVDQMLANLRIGQRGTGYVIDGQGKILYDPEAERIGQDASGLPGAQQLRRDGAGTLFYKDQEDEQWAAGYAPVPAADWGVVVREPWSEAISPMMQFSVISPALVILAALVSLAAVYLTVRYVIRPLRVLDRVAGRVASGDFEATEEPVEGVQEVKDLHATLRHMAAQIQRYQAGMQSYIAAVTQGQEEERKRLARELHDDTAQALVGLIQRIKLTRRDLDRNPARAAERMDELVTLATAAWQDVRHFSEDLRPPYLEQFGLEPAIAMLAEQTRDRGGPEVSITISGAPRRLSPDLETAVYRILQEALSNVRQHAQASHVQAELRFADQDLAVTIQDDGVGFKPPELPGDLARQGHFGLAGMRERALLVGGHLSVESTPGLGTRVVVRIPTPPEP